VLVAVFTPSEDSVGLDREDGCAGRKNAQFVIFGLSVLPLVAVLTVTYEDREARDGHDPSLDTLFLE
jgi:hypothetical protein